jgi:WXG100 family type VII secretion target
MAVFSVDSDAVLSSTAAIRGTIDRLQGETSALMAQLTGLQGSWTGAAAAAFHSTVEQWRTTQRQVEETLGGINGALAIAGRQYAEAEQASMSLFR